MPKTEDKDLKYVVLDLETSGGDETTDVILEVGIVIVDANLDEITRRSWVVWDEHDKLSQAKDVVREMHAANGLAAAVKVPGLSLPIDVVQADLIEVLKGIGKEHDFVLAGSGVSHFDRRFLNAYMPRLMKWFRYYNIDVGVMRRGLRLIGREDLLLPDSGDKTHRALEDALLHLEELRFMKEALGKERVS